MTIKLFAHNEQVGEITDGMKPGAFVKIKGMTMMDKFDHELTIGSLTGVKKIPDFTVSRMDTSVKKRVELHCHTKMSDMDYGPRSGSVFSGRKPRVGGFVESREE